MSYRIGVVGDGGRGVVSDLCEKHRVPIEQAMAAAPRGRSASPLRKAPVVRTEEEVAKLRRKPPRRK